MYIDPYVSRVPLRSLLARRKALPDPAMLDTYARAPGKVVGVLVGHTHFDHAVDAPAIAARHRVAAYGSSSLAHLMSLHGLAELAVEVEPHRPYELGPFLVKFIPSRHSKLILGRKVPMDGPLTCETLDGLVPTAYRCGPVYGIRLEVAGISLYHQGSADLDDDELQHHPVDVFLAGVAGREVDAALLGAGAPAVGSTRNRADSLRRLLRSPRRPRAVRAQGGPGRATRGDRRGLERRQLGCDEAHRRELNVAAGSRVRYRHGLSVGRRTPRIARFPNGLGG